MSIIGIDFGSNAIVIGTALGMSGGTGRGGIDVILNGNSQRRTPNIVSFVDKERFMGEQAEPYVRSKVNNTITSLNRILGHNFSEPIIQNELARLAYKVVKSDGDKISIEVQYNGETRSFTPEQVTAMILSHCCELAQKAQNNYSKPDVVVAVPSYWTDSQRRAIKNACDIADVSCLGIVNSSTATCIDYGIFRNLKGQFAADKPTNVMFYDMGYSDTVCSIVSYYNGKFVVQAVAYDVNLGGRDVDDLIVNKIADEFTTKYHIDPRKNKKSMVKIQTAAEKAKKTLSPQGVDRTPISIECVCEDRDYNGILYLKDFEALLTAANLPQRCQNVIQDALVQCGFTPKDIEIVEICGGGIRVPLLKRTVAEYMQRNLEAQNFGLNTTLNMDETVGRGSAIKCAMLSPRIRIKDVAIEDKNLFNIGISINGTQSILFPRYCSYPAEKVLSLPGYNNYEIEIGYTENNRLPPEADRHICKILIQADDHMKEENAAITLSISLDQEGCIRYNTTQITIPQPDIQVEKIVKKPAPAPTEGEKKEEAPAMVEEKVMETQHVPPKVYIPMVQVTYNTMDTGVIDNCKKCEVDMKAFDKALRETKHAKNELESFIYNMRDKFYGTYNDYILEEEKNKIMAAMEEEENWIYSYEGETATKDTYEARLKTLQEMTHDVIFRYTEAEGRKDLINRLNTVITYCNTLLASTEEKYAHITKEERDPLLKEVAELKEWFDATYNKQLTLNKYENPVLLCNDMKIKGNAIYEKVYKAMSKPKPVEKPTTPKDKDVDMEKKEEPQKEEPQKEEPQKEEPQKEEDVDMEKKDEDVKME